MQIAFSAIKVVQFDTSIGSTWLQNLGIATFCLAATGWKEGTEKEQVHYACMRKTKLEFDQATQEKKTKNQCINSQFNP